MRKIALNTRKSQNEMMKKKNEILVNKMKYDLINIYIISLYTENRWYGEVSFFFCAISSTRMFQKMQSQNGKNNPQSEIIK